MKALKNIKVGDFVYSSFHRANVMVVAIWDERKGSGVFEPKRINTAGYCDVWTNYLPYQADEPTIYHKQVSDHGWQKLGEI